LLRLRDPVWRENAAYRLGFPVLGDHQVKENAWITVIEGTVQITADGETIDASPGVLVRFEPNERHALRSESGARILMLLAPWPGEGHYRGSA
jgi:quercetin dioxygenase-like cupin family protein